MKYNSTRGTITGYSFEDAILSPGYVADGGLLLPETIPEIGKEILKSWAKLSFTDICKEVLSLFISEDEIPRKDLNDVIDKAYAKLGNKEVVHLSSLGENLNILEMFHVRTLAFKDLSTYVVGQLLSYFLQKNTKHITVLVGTSGDTGSSSIEALRGLDGIDIVVLYPKGRITNIQERSMTTVIADNVHVYAVDGTSDDADAPIRALSLDQEFSRRHNLMSANSINIGRVLCQAIAYFYAYLRLCPSCDRKVEIISPTGAGGSITGGVIASMMGLPVKLVCAVNENDIIHRTLANGDYSKRDKVTKTLSSAMDIQIPYNLERIFWLFSKDSKLVSQLQTQMKTTGAVNIPDNLLKKISSVISSYSCNDLIVKETMQRCWKENSYLLCPHTAVAVSCFYAKQTDKSHIPTVNLATASPAKFPEAVLAAGLTPENHPIVEQWLRLPTHETPMRADQDWCEILRRKVEDIFTKVGKKSSG